MNWREYVAEREATDPEFKAAREEMRPQFEFRLALVSARIEGGLTQRDLARRLGVKQSALARWEAGQTMPTLDTLFRVAQTLDLDFAITPDARLVVTPHGVAPDAAENMGAGLLTPS